MIWEMDYRDSVRLYTTVFLRSVLDDKIIAAMAMMILTKSQF